MASRRRGSGKKALLFAAVFFVALLGIGLMSIKSSNYKDVSELKAYREPVKGLNVQGTTVNLPPGTYRLVIGSTVFEFKVGPTEAPYAVAKRVQGPPLGSDDEYAVFILRGKDGTEVLALFSAKTFKNLYGATPVMEQRVVVNGEFNPKQHAVLYIDTPNGPRMLGSFPVFWVDKILEGCHQSYEAPSGRIA